MRATTAALLLNAPATTLASLFDTILPTSSPLTTEDYWTCTTRNLSRFFDPPRPTKTLYDALWAYDRALTESCTPTPDVIGIPTCPFPAHSELCAFTTAAPSTMVAEFAAYAAVASSWWAAHSSDAVVLARDCPALWFTAMRFMPNGWGVLNSTIAYASCFEEMRAADGAATAAGGVAGGPTITGATATVGAAGDGPPPRTTTAGMTATGTATTGADSVASRADCSYIWVIAGTGLVAAAMNSVLFYRW